MRTEDIIRAWKDASFRESLNEEQQANLPDSPVGMVELGEEGLTQAAGGAIVPIPISLLICSWLCPSFVPDTYQCCPFTWHIDICYPVK